MGQEHALVSWRRNWGEDRVYFHDESGRLISIPAAWTSVIGPDPFVAISKGRALFRVEDLERLRSLLVGLEEERHGSGPDGKAQGV